MFSRIFNLLLFQFSATLVFGQTLSPVVTSCLGAQYNAGNAGLSVTVGQPFPGTQIAANSIVTAGFQQPELQINTDTLPVSVICNMQSLNVSYYAWGYIDPANVFTAQLSDSAGSFANPTSIGSKTGTASGVINATLPAILPVGSNYKIRVVGSGPQIGGRTNPGSLSTGSCVAAITEPGDVSSFSSFPNPTSGIIYFSSPKNMAGKISVFDINGKLIVELPVNGQENQTLDISKLAPGIYIATCQNVETTFSTKIIKQ